MTNRPEPAALLQPPVKPVADGRQLAVGAAAILLAVFAANWPALAGQFLWDDFLVVHRNPLVTGRISCSQSA